MLAVKHNKVEVVRALVKGGAKVDYQNPVRHTEVLPSCVYSYHNILFLSRMGCLPSTLHV